MSEVIEGQAMDAMNEPVLTEREPLISSIQFSQTLFIKNAIITDLYMETNLTKEDVAAVFVAINAGKIRFLKVAE